MSLYVKICGLTDRRGIEAAADAGADAVGFVFYEKSPRSLTPVRARELAAAVPDGVLKVAVMLHPETALCDEVLATVEPDVLQTDLSDFAYLNVPEQIERWPVVRENEVGDETGFPPRFVYEGRASGKGMQVDWSVAAKHARRGDMILAGGLDARNIAEAVRLVGPWGVDVSSAVESAPGVKDPGKIREFVVAAKAGHAKGNDK